jgi:hypothetical protein
MRHLALACGLAAAAAAYGCGPDRQPPLAQPTPVAMPVPQPPVTSEIPLRTIRSTIKSEKRYTVEVPADGTLAGRLSWKENGESGFPVLYMLVDDNWESLATTCDDDGIADLRTSVRAGQKVEIYIFVGNCWDYGFDTIPATEFLLELTLITG